MGQKTENIASSDFFNTGSTAVLKGLALVLLITGHFFVVCVDGVQVFDCLGEYAVFIFIMLSGVGLTKKYALNKCKVGFIYSRVLKIFIPLWLSLLLFIMLDWYFLDRTYSLGNILLNGLGIRHNRIGSINPVIWYVSYIWFLWITYYIASALPLRKEYKLAFIFTICYAVNILIGRYPFIQNYLGEWRIYQFVFPVSITFTLYMKSITKLFSRIYSYSVLLYLFVMGSVVFLYYIPGKLKTVFLILFVFLCVFFVEKQSLRLKLLAWLGGISYEAYLLHLPLLTSYSLLKGKLSLLINLPGYIVLVLILSLLLKNISGKILNKLSAGKSKEPENSFLRLSGENDLV